MQDGRTISLGEWRTRRSRVKTHDPGSTPLERVAQGEPGAMVACVDAYTSLVWSLARRWFGQGEDAEDAVQEVFVELWKSAGRFDPTRASDRGFVAMIARRRFIDRRRKFDRRVETESMPTGFDIGTSEHERIEGRVMAAPALAALDTLPEDRREFVMLSVVYGMSHQEVSDKTGAPLGTVKSGIRRGLMAMRDVLTQQGMEEVGR